MKRLFRLIELFFSPECSISSLVTSLLKKMACLTEDESRIMLSRLPNEEDIEEAITSLIFSAESIIEMKINLCIVKELNFLSLQEECALANRLLCRLGFSEVIGTSITLEDALESEEELFEEDNEDQ